MTKPQPKNVIAKLASEIDALPDNPRVLVTVSHCYLELFVALLAEKRCRNAARIKASSRDYPHSIRIALLQEAGIVSDRWADLLHWFRKLRNAAAHEVEFEVTRENLAILRGLKITGTNLAQDDPANLRKVCAELVMGFWNAHVDDMAQLFMPELFPSPPAATDES